MVNVSLDKGFELSTVRSFQYAETPNVQWLGEMRGVYRQAEGDNLILFAELVKLSREVTFMTIKDNHPIYPPLPGLSVLVEVFDPF